jgi:hypothetical protein
MRGLRTSRLHPEQIRTGSSFQNSISAWQWGQVTRKMSSGRQYR